MRNAAQKFQPLETGGGLRSNHWKTGNYTGAISPRQLAGVVPDHFKLVQKAVWATLSAKPVTHTRQI